MKENINPYKTDGAKSQGLKEDVLKIQTH